MVALKYNKKLVVLVASAIASLGSLALWMWYRSYRERIQAEKMEYYEYVRAFGPWANIDEPRRSFVLAHRELFPVYSDERSIDCERSGKLFAALFSAYETNDAEAIKRISGEIEDLLDEVNLDQYNREVRPVKKAFCREVNPCSPTLREFNGRDALEQYLRSNMQIANALSRFAIRNRLFIYSSTRLYELEMLQLLCRYERKYRDENDVDSLAVVEVCQEEWRNQIESESGFARQWFRLQLLEMKWTYDHGLREIGQEIEVLKQSLFPEAPAELQPSWMDLEIEKVFGKMGGGEKGESR
ncbi:MAG: hypothetical protein ACI4TC_06255 [Kiritimatiellia bacterium]